MTGSKDESDHHIHIHSTMGWCHDSIVPWPPSSLSSPSGDKARPTNCTPAVPMSADQWTWHSGLTRDEDQAVGQAWTIDHSYDSSSKRPESAKSRLRTPAAWDGTLGWPKCEYILPKGRRGSPQSAVDWTMHSAGQTERHCLLGAAAW